jgi:hypothetical protein
VSTHTANFSAYTRAKFSVIPNFKHNASSGDISSAKHSAILDVQNNDNQLHLILARVVTLVLTSAIPNVTLVLASVDLTVNLNSKL